MEILIVFAKEKISSLSGNRDDFSKEIIKIGKTLSSESKNEDVHIQIVDGAVPDISDDIKIVVYISSENLKNNMGALIVEFKRCLLKIFDNYGLPLTRKEVEVRANPSFNIEKFIEQIKSQKKVKNMESNNSESIDEFDYEKKSKQYIPVDPLYSFDRVILQNDVKEKIEEAIAILECENKVFNEWGLYEIQPHPSTSLSFFGPSGTGKTMAAEAVAEKLGKKILKVSYADVESKYHGEGPKMVKAIFLAAKNADAVLFFDEADSLLSKRLTNVSQGSEQAINSMRSQLLICLEEFRGIVIFATNLVINYDQAFLTRLISVEFKIPDLETRKQIWNVHIRPLEDGKEHKLNIPLNTDVNIFELAEKYEFVGREIRNAVVSACVSVALAGRNEVTQNDFIKACDKIVAEKKAIAEAKDHTKSPAENFLAKAIKNKLDKEAQASEQSKKEEMEEK